MAPNIYITKLEVAECSGIVNLHAKILEGAEKLEFPLHAPIELHIISKEELKTII